MILSIESHLLKKTVKKGTRIHLPETGTQSILYKKANFNTNSKADKIHTLMLTSLARLHKDLTAVNAIKPRAIPSAIENV